eukprot:SAG11_NODE_443_length_9422_cov_4.441382_5_plen_69_part_00
MAWESAPAATNTALVNARSSLGCTVAIIAHAYGNVAPRPPPPRRWGKNRLCRFRTDLKINSKLPSVLN